MENRLKLLANSLGLKNKELAEVLGVTPNAVTEVFKGRTKYIPTKWVIILIEKFQINAHWLLTGEGSIYRKNNEGAPNTISSNIPSLSQNYQNLSSKEIENIQDYIEFLNYQRNKKDRNSIFHNSLAMEINLMEIPVLGNIAAGAPILAQENIEKIITLPQNTFRIHGELFGLRIKGDSMINAGIFEEDIAIIKKVVDISEISNNEIAAILLDNEATIKYLIKKEKSIILKPANPKYSPFEITEKDNPSIIGKLIGLIREY